MIKTISIVSFLIILFAGCEKIFDFPEKGKYQKNPVIEAIITDKADYQKIRISFSSQFNDSLSSVPIANALVKIAYETGDTVKFQYTENGWYTNNIFTASPNKTYTLLVQIDTAKYKAISKMIPANGLDSVAYTFHKNADNKDSAYYLKIYAGITDPDNQKYYQLQIYKNAKLFTTSDKILFYTDLATFSLNGVELNFGFAKGDTLDLEMYSLTKEMYNYYIYIYNSLLYNGGNDLDFKTNPPNQFTPKALGYFQVSSLSRKRIIIK